MAVTSCAGAIGFSNVTLFGTPSEDDTTSHRLLAGGTRAKGPPLRGVVITARRAVPC
jgi:hypothetical protein